MMEKPENIEGESIFDYNPTEDEIKRFGGLDCLLWAINKGIYKNADNRNYDLGILFSSRGDKEKAIRYFDKIEHKDMLQTLMQDF